MCGKIAPFLLIAFVACAGELNESEQLAGAHSADPDRMSSKSAENPGKTETTLDFAIDQSGTRLLPFDVRVSKLEAATGMDRTDPSFSGLLAASVELGASDHAAGIAADLSWTANRIATWVRHIKPICASQNFATYGTVEEFFARAYGREATPEDTDMLAQEQHLITCLAVLTSTEFVLQ